MDPNGRRIIVAGGAGHLGRGIAQALIEAGAKVAVLDQIAAEGLPSLVCDLADPAAVDAALAQVEADLGGPASVLVNAVGLIHSAPLINVLAKDGRRHSLADWETVMRANLTAVFVPTVAAVDRMVATRTKGVVISLSSVTAAGNAGQGAYSAAKAAVNAATAAWAKELGPIGIRFVALALGFIDTPSTRAALSEEQLSEWRYRTPLRRLGTIADVAAAVQFAIRSDHLTGRVVELDGGVGV